MFQLVRFWSRRWINRASEQLTGEMRHVQHILVVDAVHTASSGADVTVADVAHQLGLDHSGASRMVRDATSAGYVERRVSAADRRRASLQLTDTGSELLAGSRRWQRQEFDRLTADWSDHDRRQLGEYLHRIAKEVGIDG